MLVEKMTNLALEDILKKDELASLHCTYFAAVAAAITSSHHCCPCHQEAHPHGPGDRDFLLLQAK